MCLCVCVCVCVCVLCVCPCVPVCPCPCPYVWVYVMCVSVYLYVVCERFCMCIATFIQWCVCASVQCLCTFRVPDGDTMYSILGDMIHVQKAWYTNLHRISGLYRHAQVQLN